MSKSKTNKKKPEPVIENEKKSFKARLSFLIEISADNKQMLDEAIDDIKFHFKNIRTSGISVENGVGYNWRVVKQKSNDVIVKIIKEVK